MQMNKKFQSSMQDHHFRTVMITGEQMLQDGRLTDFIITCKDQTFFVHKFILACSSPYFYELLVNRASKSDELQLDLIQPKSFEIILKFFYAGCISILEEEDLSVIVDVLVGASVFQVPQINFYCLRLLVSQPSLCCFLLLWNQIEELNNDDVKSCYLEFVKSTLSCLKEKEAFLTLLPTEIVMLLGILNLASVQPDEILDCILLWLKKDWKTRKVFIKTLGAFIRFEELSESNVRYLLENEAILQKISYLAKCLIAILQKKAPSSQEFKNVDNAKEYSSNCLGKESSDRECLNESISHQKSDNRLLEENESFLPNEPMDLETMQSQHRSIPESLLDRIDMMTENEKSSFTLETAAVSADIGELILYAFGVEVNNAYLPLHKFFSFKQKRWVQITFFPSEFIYYPSICSYKGILYFCGGGSFNNKPPTNTCLTFEPKQGCWKYINSMSINRCYAGLTELGGYLYAVGGYNGRVDLRSVEKYNPITDKWMFESPLPCTVQFPEVVAVAQFLCVLDGLRLLYYNPFNSRWFQGLYLPEEIRNVRSKIAAVENQIIVIPKHYPRFVYQCSLNSSSWRIWPIPNNLFSQCFSILGHATQEVIQFSVVTSDGFYIYEPPKYWYPSDLLKHDMYFMNAAIFRYH